MKNWYSIKALAGARRAEVLIFGKIGVEGVMAKPFTQELAVLDVDEITCRINSPGGDVFEALAIMTALQRHPATVTAVVEGLAASSAAFIAIGVADRLVLRPHSQLMIHDAWTISMGNVNEFERVISRLNAASENFAQMCADKAGGSREYWRERMREETWYTADEAVQAGLADEVISAKQQDDEAPINQMVGGSFALMEKFKYAGRADAPAPKLPKEEPMSFIKDVAARLGVESEDSTVVLAALEEVLAEQAAEPAEEQQEEPVEVEQPAEPAESAPSEPAVSAPSEPAVSNELTVTIDAAALAELQEQAAYGAQAMAREEQARQAALVDAAIKENKISAAAREGWLKKMAADPDLAQADLESLPANIIPRAELGYGVSNSDDAESSMFARATSAGVFRPLKL